MQTPPASEILLDSIPFYNAFGISLMLWNKPNARDGICPFEIKQQNIRICVKSLGPFSLLTLFSGSLKEM